MTIKEKYNLLRPQISDGDLILVHGTGIVAKIIRNCDKSYYSHIGVVTERHGALFIVDANGNGVQADRLSYRIDAYKNNADFTILKPMANRNDIDTQMAVLLKRSDIKTIKYDFRNGIKELFNRKFKPEFKIDENDNYDICSDFVSKYAVNLGMVNEMFLRLRVAFPEDFMRYVNYKNVKIIP